uniref:Xylulose kinase-1 n=1 Tax=Tanacetum cinerariifolium TaxID=118510 RepID=A0A699JWA4_TANCI|nr:hypothetical protein [Tanacetum cinerariifolium]
MALTFADTHNIIAYLTKSDASEGFDQIIYFLNASSIKYALTINPNIYVSCIKQFWTFVSVIKVNDVTRLQALVDKKNVIITEAIIRDALRLDDEEGIDCLSNEEIFVKLSRMGYAKPSTKLTFYKAFFLPQWKFMIHTILQCMRAKRTSWNEFSSSMASAVICLFTGKGFLGVDTPLFEGIIVEQQVDESAAKVNVDDDPAAGVADQGAANGRIIASMDVDVDVNLKDVADIAKEVAVNAEIEENKVLSMHDDEVKSVELQEVVEVVTTAKLITKVVTAASATITDVAPTLTIVATPTLTTAPSAARR